jgi:hypothetical protein
MAFSSVEKLKISVFHSSLLFSLTTQIKKEEEKYPMALTGSH